MDRTILLQRLTKLLKEDQFIEADQPVALQTRFIDLCLDQEDVWDLTGYFESDLRIAIPDEQISGFSTVGDVVEAAYAQFSGSAQSGAVSAELLVLLGLGLLLLSALLPRC